MAASEWRGFCRRCGGEIGTDGLYCVGCQAEETSAQMLDDMVRQRDAEVAENARLQALLAERDALAARLAAAEAALEAAHRVICVNTALYHRSAHGGKRFTDFTECPEPSCATASRAALAGSREQAAGEGE